MNNIVLYHKNCLDGTCAAWVASQYLPKNTVFIPVEYGKTMRDQVNTYLSHMNIMKQQTLYILDWCPEMDDLDQSCKLFGKVVVIDHHESAIKKLKAHYCIDHPEIGEIVDAPKNLEVFLAHNNEWSGAMGTAIYFADRPHDFKDKDILTNHWLVKAVDDRDRWQFKLPDTKAINEYLFLHGFELSCWTDMDWGKETKINIINTGETLIEKKQQDCQSIIQSSAMLDSNAEKIIFCNCPPFLASETGNILAKDYRMAVLWFMDKEGQISVSLRSNPATPAWINCSKIAMELDGGGHANAAGFKINCSFEEVALKLDDAIIATEQNITEIPF